MRVTEGEGSQNKTEKIPKEIIVEIFPNMRDRPLPKQIQTHCKMNLSYKSQRKRKKQENNQR